MENTNQNNGLPEILKNGILLVPSIGIPYLFGMTAFKVAGFIFETAGSVFNQVKNVVGGQAAPAPKPEK